MRTGVLVGASLMVAAGAAAAAPVTAAAASASAAGGDAEVPALLAAALPADGATDIVLVDWPAIPGAPHVRAATACAAPPAAIKRVLLDPRNYRKVVPALIRADVSSQTPAGPPSVGWEIEVPLFNLQGTLAINERPDGAEVTLVDGDLSPGRLTFTALPRAGVGTTLLVDAQVDIRNSGWLIRRIIKLSPAGEPAGLAAAAYVTLRAVALRAQHIDMPRATRPTGTPAPPPEWSPSPRALADGRLAALRARGVVALVGRTWSQRLAGVAVAATLGVPAPHALGRLRDPQSWHAFPGWTSVKPLAGPNGVGAEVEDSLPFVDLEATWHAEPGGSPRWTATDGVTTGARMGWELYPLDPRANAGATTLMALMLYPRLETTGRLARKAIASEPLLEHGLAVAVAFADLTAMKTALEAAPR